MKKSILVAGVAALVLAACSSGSDQDKTADALIRGAENEGVEVDSGCVKDVTSELSDEDAKALADLPDGADPGDATLSAAGEATLAKVFGCADLSAQFDEASDELIADLRESGADFDEQCVRDAVSAVDPAALADGEAPDGFQTALSACVTGG